VFSVKPTSEDVSYLEDSTFGVALSVISKCSPDYKEPIVQNVNLEQEVINLSKEKWRWMSERKVDSLAALFHEKAVFVHMGGTMTKEQELDVIQSGRIHYQDVDIQEVSVRFIGTTTAILLNKIRLVAVVGGNEVTNPFVVTEVYVQQNDTWMLASLSFTRLLTA
jgi:hypothetical protein